MIKMGSNTFVPQPPGTHSHEATEPSIIVFKSEDIENPATWSTAKKALIVVVGLCGIFNSVFGTSFPSGESRALGAHFGVENAVQLVLPITIYQCGFICGSLTFGPLSETYGRRPVVMGSSGGFAVFTLISIFMPTWSDYLGLRFLQGCCAASAIAVTGGLYADIFDEPRRRGQANALFLCATSVVPNLAPLTSAYSSFLSWDWPLWIEFIFAATTTIPILFLPETYGPIILKRRAIKCRVECGPDCNIYAAIELEQKTWKEIVMVFMARPIRMMLTEWIVSFTCISLGFATGIYYLFFVAYSIIFTTVYGLDQAPSRLLLLPVAGGCLLGFILFFAYDHVLYRSKALNKPWSMNEEYRRLPIACAGGPLCVAGLFWLGWTARSSVPLAVPAASGAVFGLGFYFILMALNNYLADAYKIYSSSAMAAVSFARSVWGGFLPLAADAMYDALDVQWATSLLGFIMLFMCLVPFAFIRYGKTIRAHSTFCQQLSTPTPLENNGRPMTPTAVP